MRNLFLGLCALVIGFSLDNLLAAEEHKYPDFSIQIPETWKAVELDNEGESRSWLFGKQATEDESGFSIAIHILEIGEVKFDSETDLILAKDRFLNKNIHTIGKSKRVLNTSIIYDEVIDGENFRAVNFKSLFSVKDRPELELRIFGRIYVSIINSKIITINFQGSESHEYELKPKLEKIVYTMRLTKK